jgi:hypothetical protein
LFIVSLSVQPHGRKWVCPKLAQLDRPHERQYIALHNKIKSYFCDARERGHVGLQNAQFALDLA